MEIISSCWSSRKTQVYYNEPTTPLAHWSSTTDHRAAWSLTRSDPNGLAKDSSVLARFCMASCVRLAALLSSRDCSFLSAIRSFLLLTMTLILIASPCPGRHVTLSSAWSLTAAHHSSSDGAISPPYDILPLRLNVPSVTCVQLTGLNTQGCFILRLLTVLGET